MKQSRLHLLLTILWVGLAIPTILWWRESVFWVSIMSLYAIVVSHWGALQAAKAKETIEKENDHDQ